MKNITFSGRMLTFMSEEFSEKEIGLIVKAAVAYAEDGTRTDFKDRGMRLAYELLMVEMSVRENNRERQARYRQKKKGGETG